jgi:hypothetical protein
MLAYGMSRQRSKAMRRCAFGTAFLFGTAYVIGEHNPHIDLLEPQPEYFQMETLLNEGQMMTATVTRTQILFDYDFQ